MNLEKNVENYKRYLTLGFGVIEFAVSRFLHFNEISGFAAEQMTKMNTYEQILYELGEKYKPKPKKSGLPPEMKLMGIMVFNAAVFVGMKMLTKGVGNAVMNDNYSSHPSPPPTTSGKPMRGPQFNPDDFA